MACLLQGLAHADACTDRQLEKGRPIRTTPIVCSILDVFAEYVPLQIENLTIRLDIRNLFDETCAARGPDGTGTLGAAVALMNRGAR